MMNKEEITKRIEHSKEMQIIWRGEWREQLWKAVQLTYEEFLEV